MSDLANNYFAVVQKLSSSGSFFNNNNLDQQIMHMKNLYPGDYRTDGEVINLLIIIILVNYFTS